MNKSQPFFATLKRSLYDVSFYQEVADIPFFSILKYLYLLILLTLFIGSIRAAIYLVPQAPKLGAMFNEIKGVLKGGYPEDLILTFKDGELASNSEYPVVFDTPSNLLKPPESFHLIIIDTNISIDDISKYNAGIILTKKAFITKKESGGYEVSPYDKKLDFTLDKSTYDVFIAKINPYLDNAPKIIAIIVALFLLLGPFVLGYFMIMGKLLFVLFTTVFFFALAKVLKKTLTYRQLYKLGLYGLTIQIILSTIKDLIPRWYSTISAGSSGQILAWIIQIYNNLPNLAYLVLMVVVVVKFGTLAKPMTSTPVATPTG